jgi:thiosulfate/3-mercaptopyruvate sulfurtransferase
MKDLIAMAEEAWRTAALGGRGPRKGSAMGPIPSEPPAPGGPLVTADWLQDNLDDPRVRVLDVRGRHPSSALPHAKHAEYAAGHIPGAVFVDWEHDFVDADNPVPVQLACADAFAARAGELGVSEQNLVVTYDDYYGIFAARVAWAFRYHGAESRVLDGGWTSWKEEGRPISTETVTPERRQFVARPRPKLRRTLADVQEARNRGAALVDARPRHLFLGEKGVANTGHIPGSRSLPYQELVDGATGLWAAPDAVRRLVSDAGVDPDRPPRELIATCGSGVSATVALFSLERIGIHADGVYDGSFNEWSAAHAPVEYGSAR